jgi:hypothetical protein
MGTSIKKRFKILALFALHLDIWEENMFKLANAINEGHPKAEEVLSFYEDELVKVLEKDLEEFGFSKN